MTAMKRNRHDKILEIIREQEIETQGEMARVLRENGYEVTQATVSRDIRRLGLTKAPGRSGKLRYVISPDRDALEADKYARVLRDGIVSVVPAQNLLVIRTSSGMAMAAAAALDGMQLPEVVGSIAGDDTIFVAVHSASEAEQLTEKLTAMLGL